MVPSAAMVRMTQWPTRPGPEAFLITAWNKIKKIRVVGSIDYRPQQCYREREGRFPEKCFDSKVFALDVFPHSIFFALNKPKLTDFC